MAPVPSTLKRLAFIALIVAFSAAVPALRGRVGFAASPAAEGQRGDVGSSPRRIISLVPATTEMLFAMGAGDRIAGVSNYDRFPPDVEKLPKVGGLIDPNVERVISLKPDLVIVYDTQTDLKEQLARAGIPIFRYAHRGLPDITETMRALGERVGAKAAAETAAARIEQDLAATRARVAQRPPPRTILIFGRDPGSLRRITASGGYGFLHDILELAGGRDIFSDLQKQSVDVSTELMLTRGPEVILELRYGPSEGRESEQDVRRVWSALPSVPAVRNNRIYVLSGEEFVIPGPRIVIAADRMARALHPEAYGR